MANLSAGAAKAIITPPVGVPMGAFGLRQGLAQGVHDHLYARALVLDDGLSRTAVVSLDVSGITKETLHAIESRVQKLVGIPPIHLLVNSTHNHTSPDIITTVPPYLETYTLHMADQVAGAVYEAANRLGPASAGFAWGDLPGATVNRQDRERPVDTSVGVLRIDGSDGRPLARIINWACHNLCVGGQYLLWSADFTGVACEFVEEADPGSVCLFLSGAGGDVHPFDWWFGNTESNRMNTYDDARDLGEMLGAEAMATFQRIATERTVPLAVVSRTIPMPRHRVSWTAEAAQLQHDTLLHELGSYTGETWPEGTNIAVSATQNPEAYGNGFTQLVLARDQDKPPVPAELRGLRIGDLLIACSPGELFNELGREIKDGVGRDRTWVASYCADYIGYISTRMPHEEIADVPLDEIVDQARYRRFYGTTNSPFAPEAGEDLVTASVNLALSLK